MMPFEFISPDSKEVPILISVPHCGTLIPPQKLKQYDPEMIRFIDDTDWFVDQLYDFASSLGITMIKAKYSRWLIDLNRSAESIPLYNDGRVITALTPGTDFNGKLIYIDGEPNDKEIQSRIESYYLPYYRKIEQTLYDFKNRFKNIIFFDAHSIRQHVPGIRSEKFPDLILGDVDGKSAGLEIIKVTDDLLQNSKYSYSHNHPFKGGNLTRTFGNPTNNIHALQLEMSKTVYMDESQLNYDVHRADNIKSLLKKLFENLISSLQQMNKKS